ncbi:Imm52 family immunity protein [Cupriavidus basilensis]|uniref:Imm52 family immunity protein n=1 Tax=Cupriavidus basilensis TaxID=68895 RepID=UPI00351C7D7D
MRRCMLVESFLAAAYWGTRKESMESCATRVQRFLSEVATLSPDFTGWRKRRHSRK